MEMQKVFLGCLLTAFVGIVVAQSPVTLLQEGMYAEQTEGNLDKAIEIYQQVVDQAEENKRIAAQATYQMGVCWQQKGEVEKAAEYFRKVVKDYSNFKNLTNRAKKRLNQLNPGGESGVFGVLHHNVLARLSQIYGKICAEAGEKNLYSNSHIHFVDTEMKRYSGGMGYHYNKMPVPIQQRVRLSGTSFPNTIYYDVSGQKMNIDIVEDSEEKGFYHIYWTPDQPLAANQYFMYGWTSPNEGRKLQSDFGKQNYTLNMQNFYGSRVIETFFLVLPKEIWLKDSTEPFTGKETVGKFTVYYWKKEVPNNTNNHVIATLSFIQDLSAEEIDTIVDKAVKTISTCAETDPKVKPALDKIRGLDSSMVVDSLLKYLDSETSTIRRTGIYILWRGQLKDISAAGPKLIELCNHQSGFTRGMAALAIGEGKIPGGYDSLALMLQDSDGYARRCAAYALGAYGDPAALELLEAALEDSDPMVKSNIEAAIEMLTKDESK